MDLIFDAMSAFDQAGLIVGGLVCLLIAGLILADHLYWSLKGTVVEARIEAVRVETRRMPSDERSANAQQGRFSGEIYFPVFAYETADGQQLRAESPGGSGSLLSHLPGQSVRIHVLPDQPRRAARKGWLWPLVGLLLGGAGLALIGAGLGRGETTYLVIPMVLILVGAGLRKTLRKAPDAPGEAASKDTPETRLLAKRVDLPLLTRDQIQERLAEGRDMGSWQGPVLVLLAMASAGFGIYEGRHLAYLEATGARATGEVVDVLSRRSGGSRSFHAVIRFEDAAGVTHRFDDRFGQSGRAPIRDGASVEVLYDPRHPEDAIVARGLTAWLVPGGLIAFGALMFFAAFDTARRRRRIREVLDDGFSSVG